MNRIVPDQTLNEDAETTAKRFRGYVLKPADGVFLFHPRAIERLVAAQLGPRGYAGSMPDLAYHVMPRAAFLTGLETENPEALAVIEGLDLPPYIVLLPIPPEQRLDEAGFNRLLRDYWARRFEAEIARAWQMDRDARGDASQFGPEALRARIGEPAFAELRDVLTRDGIVPAEIADDPLCRAFVAHLARLRYFFPGARGFFFPGIRDWASLDDWLRASGLELPPTSPGAAPPRLLTLTRPSPDCGQPIQKPLLPPDLDYGCSDPDSVARDGSESRSGAAPPARPSPAPAEPPDPPSSAIETRCLATLVQIERNARLTWSQRIRIWLAGLLAPLLELLLILPVPRRRWRHAPPRGLWLELQLLLFRYALRRAHRAEARDRHAAAILYLARARERFRIMSDPRGACTDRIPERLTRQTQAAGEALTQRLGSKWKLAPDVTAGLRSLVERLSADLADSPGARAPRTLLRCLERVLLESRATYFELQLLAWFRGRGQVPPRQILPFQARLKALRALDMALVRMEHLGWSVAEAERLAHPLRALAERLARHLENDLTPHLREALRTAGFVPETHRERVAANKMLHELLDVIQRRRHLRFTDVRDIVARNILRLPDPTLDELLHGDRLTHFDRAAARALPGVYKPGEFYIKGLQQASAPIFGTPRGRLALRYLLIPLGLAFLGLKTIDLLIGLFVHDHFTLASFWLMAGLALLINAILHTRIGRGTARELWRATAWILRLLLFGGLRRLLRWPPVARLLETGLVRGLDRNLFKPLLIGLLLVLPFWGISHFFERLDPDLGLWLFAVAFAIGTLIHNTPAGRRLTDNTLSRLTFFLQRLNQALVIGLVRELLNVFKEVIRLFEQGLYRIKELLNHHLGESPPELLLKALLAPLWKLLEAFIQFYVTVLVEPQVNPIKHFPLVTIAHKLMLPFLPMITGFLVTITDPFMPRLLSYPFVTFTVLLLPGLAGFLVWELKENWRLYAANHPRLAGHPAAGLAEGGIRRVDLARLPVEPAVIGPHGETMRGMLRRGFHSGTLPKAFDRLRRVLRTQMRLEVPNPRRLREARRRLAEVEQALRVFCDRELAYALRLHCTDPDCCLVQVETRRPRLATNAFELALELHAHRYPDPQPLGMLLSFHRREPELQLRVELHGSRERLGESCWRLIREDLIVFSGRAEVTRFELV